MFDIGFSELLMVAIVGLLVLGQLHGGLGQVSHLPDALQVVAKPHELDGGFQAHGVDRTRSWGAEVEVMDNVPASLLVALGPFPVAHPDRARGPFLRWLRCS